MQTDWLAIDLIRSPIHPSRLLTVMKGRFWGTLRRSRRRGRRPAVKSERRLPAGHPVGAGLYLSPADFQHWSVLKTAEAAELPAARAERDRERGTAVRPYPLRKLNVDTAVLNQGAGKPDARHQRWTRDDDAAHPNRCANADSAWVTIRLRMTPAGSISRIRSTPSPAKTRAVSTSPAAAAAA
jgi:hypothetical protein